jgi:cytochrome P450
VPKACRKPPSGKVIVSGAHYLMIIISFKRLATVIMIWWHSYILRSLEILLALLLLRICIIYIKWRLSPLQNLPGPRGKFFLIGDFLDIYFGPFFSVHQKWWKESNYAPLMSYTSLFGRWVVLPCDPDLVKHILTAPSAQEPVRYYKQFDFFKDMLGDGLISLEGKNWSRHRRILQPCFQTGLVKDALKEALPSKVDSIIESWKKSEGRVIDVYAHMSAITLDILGVVSFAHEFNALDTITEWANDSGADKIDEIQDPMMKSLSQVFKPKLVWIIITMLKMGWLRRFDSKRNIAKQLMDEAAEDIIKAAEENKSEMKKQSLIHIMLNAMSKDESQERNALSMQELKDELKLFIVAGKTSYYLLSCLRHVRA